MRQRSTPEPQEPPPPHVAKLFREMELERESSRPIPDVLAGAFPEQVAFARDPARLKAAFCTRRAAKSYSFGLECIHDSRDWPRANYLFLGLVREEAKRIFWKEVLKRIDEKFSIGMRFNESTLTATMPNGATIYIGAADANEHETRKLLGQKYRKVAIDEAQDWRQDLEHLVFHTLKPACADMHGTIELLGTPGVLAKGLFRDITPDSVAGGMAGGKGAKAQGWSVHCWDTFANTSKMDDGRTMREHWTQEIEELRAMRPGLDETPWFRRNYLGEWVVEETALVYRYSPGRNDAAGLPNIKSGQWRYVLGCDLGHEDATAWVVCAYHEHEKSLYVLRAESEAGLDITAVARRTEALRRAYDFDVLVIDGANKQAVEEMRNRHNIPWVAADKTGKEDFIEIMNGDFIAGTIKLLPEAAPLIEDYRSLIWDEKKFKATGRRTEHSACQNHKADAALYAWRWCYQYLSEPVKPKAPPPTASEQADEHERAAEEALANEKNATRGNHLGTDSSNWEAGWKWR